MAGTVSPLLIQSNILGEAGAYPSLAPYVTQGLQLCSRILD
jgi:hypothetical protein